MGKCFPWGIPESLVCKADLHPITSYSVLSLVCVGTEELCIRFWEGVLLVGGKWL